MYTQNQRPNYLRICIHEFIERHNSKIKYKQCSSCTKMKAVLLHMLIQRVKNNIQVYLQSQLKYNLGTFFSGSYKTKMNNASKKKAEIAEVIYGGYMYNAKNAKII